MALGLYKVTARQLGSPYRPGQLLFTTPDGCETFADSEGLILTGAAAEGTAAGAAAYFAVGLDTTVKFGSHYNGQCNPQVDVTSATPSAGPPGWDANCSSAGNTPVYAFFAGGGVYHASDVSWRVASANGDPTFMVGGGYQPLSNSQPQAWCLNNDAGPFTFFAYDNNVLSASNSSQGWDGGARRGTPLPPLDAVARVSRPWEPPLEPSLSFLTRSPNPPPAPAPAGVVYITDPLGCIIFEATVEATAANGGAAINSWAGTFTVPPAGGCVPQDDRGNVTLPLAASAPPDLGTCPYSYGSLVSCTQQPPDPTAGPFNALLPNAYSSTCAAMCASQNCMELAMSVAGPVPPGTGCCNQVSGQVGFNFSLWAYNPPHVDYGLIPDSSLASSTPQFRYLANNNRVLLGLLLQQTRWAAGACSDSRFAAINDVCQLTTYSADNYGVDPAFVTSSPLYQPSANITQYYTPSEVSVYGIPYGFFPDAPGKPTFSVFFDINMREAAAQNLLQYMQDGYYIDGQARALSRPNALSPLLLPGRPVPRRSRAD